MLFACKKQEAVPENLIDKELMTEILVDIHLLEARIDHLDIPRDSSEMLYKAFEYDLLVNQYQVDTALYYESFKYYTNHLSNFTDVYDEVLKSMEKKQKEGF